MARVTVEDCLDRVDNRFELVMLAARRARQMRMFGAGPLSAPGKRQAHGGGASGNRRRADLPTKSSMPSKAPGRALSWRSSALRMTKAATSASESYFVMRLAEQARRDDIAAPWTAGSLYQLLRDYLSPEQIDEVRRALRYAEDAHAGQRRQTGHPYITHPLAVAAILAQMRMDHQTLMAALLHDVIEDTAVAEATIGARFGKPVAELVAGVSKLAKIFSSHAEAQAENFQKMILAMAKDIRVIMVKIADRLHNMRTIGVLTKEQRRRIARETLDYYAPIAYRLGMHNIHVELEDLGFQTLLPLRADRIRRAVEKARGNRKTLMGQVHQSIREALHGEGILAEVKSREKHLYSIYHKMKTQQKPFQEIMDVFGFRIIVEGEDACYRALGCDPQPVQAGGGALQGLHRHPQSQRLPIPAHHPVRHEWGAH